MKAYYDVVDATLEHIEPIASIVRQADVNEIWAQSCTTVRDALKVAIEAATIARVGRADGVPGVIYGVVDHGEYGGQIWLIGTKLIEQHRRGFLEKSQSELEDFQQTYDRLWNFVDVRNRLALRWLAWLGFTIDPPQPYGVFGKPFSFFHWQRTARSAISDVKSQIANEIPNGVNI